MVDVLLLCPFYGQSHSLFGPRFTVQMATMSSHASEEQKFSEFKKDVSVHGLLAGISFLVVLPAGVLVARYLRTFTNR